MRPFEIRYAEDRDLNQIAELEVSSLRNPWPLGQLSYQIHENPCAKVLVAVCGERVIGYLDFMITFDSSTIDRLAVFSEFRRQGIATALLKKMVEILSEQEDHVDFITLEVRKSNEKAIAFYERNGFERITEKKAYYDDGEDAIYMVRALA